MFKASAKPAQRSLIDSRYYSEGEAWETSTYRMIKSRGATWRLFAFFEGAVIVLLGLALVLLIPTQHTEVIAVEVDHTTGYLHVLRPLEDTSGLKDNEAVTAANIVQFIEGRETYDPRALKDDVDKALLLSTGNAARDLHDLWRPDNARNPLKLYGQGTTISTTIESLNFLNADTALVRFTTTVVSQSGPPGGLTYYWSANVRWKYSSAPMRMDYRFRNPLGFQVYDYRRDQERVTPVINKDAAQ